MRRHIFACLIVTILNLSSVVHAGLIGYTDRAAFMAALPGPSSTLDFDSATPGALIASGDSLGGITFTYSFGGVSIKISDAFDTASAPNFLGTNDSDVFQDGDDFDLSFASASAIGLSFITADSMVNNDIRLTAGGETVGLLASAIQSTLGDGGNVYFLGLISDSTPFSSASITADGGSGGPYFFYNVDDITTGAAVPEPGSMTLFSLLGGCAGLYGWRRRRQAAKRSSR